MGRKGRKGSIWLGSPNWKREEEKKRRKEVSATTDDKKECGKCTRGFIFALFSLFYTTLAGTKCMSRKRVIVHNYPFLAFFIDKNCWKTLFFIRTNYPDLIRFLREKRSCATKDVPSTGTKSHKHAHSDERATNTEAALSLIMKSHTLPPPQLPYRPYANTLPETYPNPNPTINSHAH